MWIRPAILGAQPSGRGGCASATVGDMCLFIGGTDRSPRAFDEVWILKMAPESTDGVSSSDWRWIRKSTTVRGGGTLPARTGATATAVGRKVYVFGGQEPSQGTCFNDGGEQYRTVTCVNGFCDGAEQPPTVQSCTYEGDYCSACEAHLFGGEVFDG